VELSDGNVARGFHSRKTTAAAAFLYRTAKLHSSYKRIFQCAVNSGVTVTLSVLSPKHI